MVLLMGVREVPKEMTVGSSIGPTALEFHCAGQRRQHASISFCTLIQVTPNVGLMKSRKGFTPAAGNDRRLTRNKRMFDRPGAYGKLGKDCKKK